MISVIIPTFGSFPRVTKLLNSIEKFEQKGSYEVILINDKPVAHTYTKLGVKNIQNSQNLGFAKSVNRGLAFALGDILLLCNDDIILTKPIFSLIEKEFTNDPHLGILGALLRYPRGGVQHAGIELDPVKKLFYHKRNPTTGYIIAVTGALFAISRATYETLGGLDESYFLACEDTKYCLDAWDKDIRVKVSKEVTAIHEEGATRGRNDMQKRKFPQWTMRELDGIGRFQKTLSVPHIKGIEAKIKILNGQQPIKLEIGSGHNPQPGYKHLDVRSDLPEVDYVCDITKSKLPFEDGQVSEILANHVIEHIPFRLLPFVLGEWARVLSPEGKLVLRTPNLRFIMEKYLAGEITPEHPGDEAFIKRNLSIAITPAWWANLKLFSGQDYVANFHHVCFDFKMLEGLLKRYGFGEVQQGKFAREYSPGELQIVAYKTDSLTDWPKSPIPMVQEVPVVIHGKAPYKINRNALKEAREIEQKMFKNIQFDPSKSSDFKSGHEIEELTNEDKQAIFEVLKDRPSNPNWSMPDHNKGLVVNSKGEISEEDNPKFTEKNIVSPVILKPKSCLVIRDIGLGDVLLTTPIIERLSKEYGIIDIQTKMPDIFMYNPHVRSVCPRSDFSYDREIDLNLAYEKNPKMHIVDAYSMVAFGDTDTPHKIDLGIVELKTVSTGQVVIHGTFSWENRTWSHENWEKVTEHLYLKGDESIVFIGNSKDYYHSYGADYRTKQSFWEMVQTIYSAKLFIGFDSGPLHVAQAVGTPSIGLFTCAKAEYRTTAKNILTVIPQIECYGCLHDAPAPVTYVGCRRGDLKCLDLITPEKVIEQYEKFRRETARRTQQQQDSNSTEMFGLGSLGANSPK